LPESQTASKDSLFTPHNPVSLTTKQLITTVKDKIIQTWQEFMAVADFDGVGAVRTKDVLVDGG